MAKINTVGLGLDYLTMNPRRYIFPVRAGQKTPPLIPDNLNKGSNDPDLIGWWGKKWKTCNWAVGLRQSKLFAIDIDNKPGHVGQATWSEYELLYGVPDTETVLSPSGNGSRHLYFDAAEHGHVFKLGKYGFGIDVDSPNYVLIPGCPLEKYDGRTYTELRGHRLAPAPLWFYSILQRREMGGPVDQEPAGPQDTDAQVAWAIKWLQEDAPPSIVGNGPAEKTTLDVAGILKDGGITYERAIDLMAQYYNVEGKCEPLWSTDEDCRTEDSLIVKIRNAYSYLRERAPAENTPEVHFPDASEYAPKPGDLPPGYAKLGDEIIRVQRWSANKYRVGKKP